MVDTSGIGLATAKAAAAEGADVVMYPAAQRTCRQCLPNCQRSAKGYAVDLSKEQKIKIF